MKTIHCPVCREEVQTKREAAGYVSFCGCEVPGEIEYSERCAITQHVCNRVYDSLYPTDNSAQEEA